MQIDRNISCATFPFATAKNASRLRSVGIEAVIYLAGLLSCLLLLGFGSIEPFSMLSFGGDSLATWNYAKSYIDGFGFRINPNLGFPGVQDNSFFPSFDFSYRAFLRVLGLFVNQAATSYYLMYLVGASAMFASAAFALRSLGFRAWISTIGAIVYVVSPYFAFRSLVHDFLALYYAAPLGAALALRIGVRYIPRPFLFFRSTGTLVSLAVIATSGLYYAFFSLLFMTFAAATASFSRKTVRPLIIALFASAIVMPVLVVTGFGTGLLDVLSGSTPTVKRAAGSQLVLGLSFAEATHLFENIPPLQWARKEYMGFAPYASTILGLEDWPGIFLTTIIFASPLILGSVGAASHGRSKWANLVFMASACIVFGIIYSMNGGLAYYFNLFVNPSIRATGRIIPFLSFFALVVVLAGVEILLQRRDRRGTLLCAITFVLLFMSMIPSIGSLAWRQRVIMSMQQHNLPSILQVLAAKDRAGINAVLQLPHVPWPEAPPIRGFDLYSLQDYYILDRKNSPTKWSYGGTSQQASYLLVAKAIEDHKAFGLVAAARDMGFDGALLEKQPYDEAEWRALSGNLTANACKVYEDNLRVLFAFGSCSDHR